MVFWKTYYNKIIDPWINCDYMVNSKSKEMSNSVIRPIKNKLKIETYFKGVFKHFKCFAVLMISFISKFQEFSTSYYCWTVHRFQTYLNYHFYEELGMNNLHILFSGDEIKYQIFFFLTCTKWQWALFRLQFSFQMCTIQIFIYISSGLEYSTH